MSLQGKVALITGAGRGIGRAISNRLADDGVDQVLASRTESELNRTRNEAAAKGVNAVAVPTDLSDPSQVEALADRALREFGRVDILVNDAGVAIHHPINAIPLDVWDLTMAVNVRAPMLLSQALWDRMVENGGGRIVNVSSVSGKRASARNPTYATSKFAVNGLTESLSRAGREVNILAYAVCPGPVATVMRAGNNPNEDPATILKPEDIAEAVAFLVSQPPRVLIQEVVIELNPSGAPAG